MIYAYYIQNDLLSIERITTDNPPKIGTIWLEATEPTSDESLWLTEHFPGCLLAKKN